MTQEMAQTKINLITRYNSGKVNKKEVFISEKPISADHSLNLRVYPLVFS